MVEEVSTKQIRAHCPDCGPERYADVLKEHNVHASDGEVWTDTDYRMLCCAGCKKVYFQRVGIFSEDYNYAHNPHTGEEEIEYDQDITYWPSPSRRKRPEWLLPWAFDPSLYRIMSETYDALNIDARVLAGIGVRTIFDRAAEVLEIDPAISFGEKVSKLFEMGKIGLDEKQHLDVLTEAGGAAAHRAWEPSVEELRALMDIMEAFIYRAFVLTKQVATLKASIPPKPKRLKVPPAPTPTVE